LVVLVVYPVHTTATNTNPFYPKIHVIKELDYSVGIRLLTYNNTNIVVGHTFDKSFNPESIDLMEYGRNVFVCCYDNQWNFLQGCIYGGDRHETVIEAFINGNHQLCIIGNSTSKDLNIITEENGSDAQRVNVMDNNNGFFAVFSLENLELIECTYTPSNNDVYFTDVEYYNSQYYLTGWTSSSHLPVTGNAIQKGKNSETSLFLLVLNENFSVGYCSYYGDHNISHALLEINTNHGDILLRGSISDSSCPPNIQNWLIILDADKYSISYQCMVGEKDKATFITDIKWENFSVIAFYGHTNDGDYYTTPEAFQKEQDVEGTSCFVTILDIVSDSIIYSSFLGGNQIDFSDSFCVQQDQDIILTGYTRSNNFPITYDAKHKSLHRDKSTFFICHFHPYQKMVYSSFINDQDFGLVNHSCIDQENNQIILVGKTQHDDVTYCVQAIILRMSLANIAYIPIIMQK
jgi:hypothetical protein